MPRLLGRGAGGLPLQATFPLVTGREGNGQFGEDSDTCSGPGAQGPEGGTWIQYPGQRGTWVHAAFGRLGLPLTHRLLPPPGGLAGEVGLDQTHRRQGHGDRQQHRCDRHTAGQGAQGKASGKAPEAEGWGALRQCPG